MPRPERQVKPHTEFHPNRTGVSPLGRYRARYPGQAHLSFPSAGAGYCLPLHADIDRKRRAEPGLGEHAPQPHPQAEDSIGAARVRELQRGISPALGTTAQSDDAGLSSANGRPPSAKTAVFH